MLRSRVARSLRVSAERMPCLSIGELLNILFLMSGEHGSVGDYIVTIKTLHTLLGDSLWAKPEIADSAPASALVQ